MPKSSKADKDHLLLIKAQPCILSDKWGHECGGVIEPHHPKGVNWAGTGQKAKDTETIPLCLNHHRTSNNAFHVMGKRPWEEKYGTQEELLEKTLDRLQEVEW